MDLERISQLTGTYGPFLLVALATYLLLETLFRGLARSRRESAAVNKRLKIVQKSGDHQNALLELRKQRGLTREGNYALPLVSLNRLILQSGREFKLGKLVFWLLLFSAIAFVPLRILLGFPFFHIPRVERAGCRMCLDLVSADFALPQIEEDRGTIARGNTG
ncbi:MAG: hypothetical protein ACK5JT_23815, partial [Hyphomicrobiaceae bacterium]